MDATALTIVILGAWLAFVAVIFLISIFTRKKPARLEGHIRVVGPPTDRNA